MVNFKVIYRADIANGGVSWEPGCPLRLSAVQVARNTSTGKCYLQLKIENLSDKTVEKFKLTAEVTYADGSVETATYKPLDADLPSHHVLKPGPIPLAGSEVVTVQAYITDVVARTTLWKSSGVTFDAAPQAPVQLSPELAAERRAMLDRLGKNPDSLGFLAEDHSTWWRCSCGAYNVGKGTCIGCALPRDTIFDLQDENALRRSIGNRKSRRTKRAKMAAAIVASAVAVAIVAVVAVAVGTNQNKAFEYATAIQLQADGESYKAYEIFLSLGDYEDSASKAQETALAFTTYLISKNQPNNAARWLEESVPDEKTREDFLAMQAKESMESGRYIDATLWYYVAGDEASADEAKYQHIVANYDAIQDADTLFKSNFFHTALKELADKEYKDTAALRDALSERIGIEIL